MRSSRPVNILWTYPWWLTSKTNRSRGVSKTRCNAMVSSTTPRFGPRWPPVCESTLINSSRTSCASWGRSCSFSALISAGERIPSNTRGAAAVSEEADVVILDCSFFLRPRQCFLFRGRLEILYHRFARIVTSNDLDPLFGAGQTFPTNRYQLHPFLIAHNQFFQHHFARFHLLDNLFQSIHGGFEIELRLDLLWGGGHVLAIKHQPGWIKSATSGKIEGLIGQSQKISKTKPR